jgi:P pilus assembly chaperone PapD
MTMMTKCLTTTLALLLTAVPVSAQVSIEVSPLRVELKAQPGGTTTQAVTIANTGAEAVRVRAELSDWFLSRDGSPQFVDATDKTYSATVWTRLAPPEQTIEPGREAIVRFSVTIPASVPPAGYRTGILFEFGPAAGDTAAHRREVQVRSRIATLIYVNVGEPPAAVELVDLRSRHTPNQPTQIIAILKNSGHRTVRTRGTVTLTDANGTVVAKLPVPDVPVLPESEREVAIALNEPDKPAVPAGDYHVEVRIDAGMPAVLVGETTVKVP